MPRTGFQDDSRDDYDDDPRPARQRSSNAGLLIGLVVAGGLLAVLVCGGGLTYWMRTRGITQERQAMVAEREAAVQGECAAVVRAEAGLAKGKAAFGPVEGAPPPVPIIDGGDGHPIVNDFVADPAGAAEKWVGKRVRIKQRVERVDGDKRGFYLALACRAHVYAAAGEADRFGAVRPGDAVEVEGTVARFVSADGAANQLPTVEAEAGRLIVNHGPQR